MTKIAVCPHIIRRQSIGAPIISNRPLQQSLYLQYLAGNAMTNCIARLDGVSLIETGDGLFVADPSPEAGCPDYCGKR